MDDHREHSTPTAAGRFLALSQVGTALMSELDESRLLRLIAQTACDLTGAAFAAFSLRPINAEGQPLVPSEGQFFHLAAVVGVTAEQEALFRRMPLGGEGLLAPIFRQGVPVLVPDALLHLRASVPAGTTTQAKVWAREAATAYAYGELPASELPSLGVPAGHPVVRSFLGAPLLSRTGEVCGGLLLGHSEPGRFTEEDQTILVSLASQAAVALENARLYRMATLRAQQLDAIFDSISDGVTLVDGQGTTVRENRAARHLRTSFAATSEGEHLLDSLLHAPAQVALSGKRDERTAQVECTDQQTRTYQVTAQPFHPLSVPSGPLSQNSRGADVEGAQEIAGAVVVWHDLTEQRMQAAARIAQAHARQLEAIFEAMTDAVFVADREGTLILTNTAARAMFSRIFSMDYITHPIAEQFTQVVLYDAQGQPLPLAQWPALRILAGEVLTPDRAAEVSIPTHDGQVLDTHMTGGPLHDAEGNLTGAVIIVRDVTERKRMEQREHEAREEAEAQQELLQLILDELPSGVSLVRGKDARLMLANQTAKALWGASWQYDQPMQAFLTKHQIRLYSPTGRPLEPSQWVTLRAVQQDETVRQYQETIRRPNGSNLPVLVNAVALGTTRRLSRLPTLFADQKTAKGEPLALVVYQDVAALKEAEYLKDEFIGIAAHELRNPVAALSGFAQMLVFQTAQGKGPPLAPWQNEALEEIDLASRRLVTLTEELLDVTRLQAGRLQLQQTNTNVVALVQRMVTRLQRTTMHCHLTLQAPAAHLMVFMDQARIEQILSNLLNNAIKYSPQGGPIEVRLQEQHDMQEILISIRDSGIGIPTSEQAQIFSRFKRANNVHKAGITGTGLGLYLCRELIELHGGRIWFESVEDVGSTFFLTLPFGGQARAGTYEGTV
jgi:signal transduction histidine kinase/GAF domain-containing protein